MIRERGVSYAQASQDLGVHQSQLRDWAKKLAEDPQHSFPGHGLTKPEQLEIAQLKREGIKLKAERDILKKAAVDSTGGCNMVQVMFNPEDRRWRKRGGPACRDTEAGALGEMEGGRVPERHRPQLR